MSSNQATVTRFSGALAGSPSAPMPANSTHRWDYRSGLLLQITTSDGRVGQGEASPLPGYSPDTLDDCEAALGDLRQTDLDEALALSETNAVFAWVRKKIPETLPAARFAIETALLDLLAQKPNAPLHRLFRLDSPASIPLSALLPTTGSAAEVIAMAQGLLDRGIRSFKLKVGFPARWAEEQRLLSALRAQFGDRIQLRLDANRAFDDASAGGRLEALSAFEPEYVEEPCPLDALIDLEKPPVRIALDEALQRAESKARASVWLSQNPGSVLVLKPMVLGGFSACLQWAEFARRHDLEVVVSHAFDGPIALLACAQLALALECEQSAAGLMPHAGLAAWPNVDLTGIEQAAIHPTSRAGLGAAPLAVEESR